MKVAVLQQYLRSLLEPLRASSASAKILADLEGTCQELESFREKDVSTLAEFLRRAKTFEEQGHWPAGKAGGSKKAKSDPINLQDFANHLRTQVGSANIEAELADLGKLTLPQLRELIKVIGISGANKKKADGQERIRSYLLGWANPPGHAHPAAGPSDGKLTRIVETLKSL